jgi:SAM-dependent methyltransferase
MNCRCCASSLSTLFVDLGEMPHSNAYLTELSKASQEPIFPLRVWVCSNCWLVQTEDFSAPEELFTADYAYFSSSSSSWLKHATAYSQQVISKLSLNSNNLVVEIASNDGYLLSNFVERNIPCLGIEPTLETAKVAKAKGIPVLTEFFGKALSNEIAQIYGLADLIIANNVLAHVPDINDFVAGIKNMLSTNGRVSIEFPHLLNLLQLKQFDTIYHEHYSYLSLHAVNFLANSHNLKVYDVEEISTHGGSLRVWFCHQDLDIERSASVSNILVQESQAGLTSIDTYNTFQAKVDCIASALTTFLQEQKNAGKKVVAYGAAAKGNTLLNYAHIDSTLIESVYDIAPSKQGKWMPGSHIPIKHPKTIQQDKPDVVLILPWNIEAEIKQTIKALHSNPVCFVKAIPSLSVEQSV